MFCLGKLDKTDKCGKSVGRKMVLMVNVWTLEQKPTGDSTLDRKPEGGVKHGDTDGTVQGGSEKLLASTPCLNQTGMYPLRGSRSSSFSRCFVKKNPQGLGGWHKIQLGETYVPTGLPILPYDSFKSSRGGESRLGRATSNQHYLLSGRDGVWFAWFGRRKGWAISGITSDETMDGYFA